jgi:hypothetical protein
MRTFIPNAKVTLSFFLLMLRLPLVFYTKFNIKIIKKNPKKTVNKFLLVSSTTPSSAIIQNVMIHKIKTKNTNSLKITITIIEILLIFYKLKHKGYAYGNAKRK